MLQKQELKTPRIFPHVSKHQHLAKPSYQWKDISNETLYYLQILVYNSSILKNILTNLAL